MSEYEFHGMTGTKTYTSYDNMMRRCRNGYSEVCDSWSKSFLSFMDDMGERPIGKTLDRIDGSKGYSPDNCRWATPKEQSINRKTTIFVTIGCEEKCLKDWAAVYGLPYETVQRRVKRGMDPLEALTKPIDSRYQRFDRKNT